MNIAMVYDPLTNITSGSAVSTLRFADLLRKRGHKVIFIAARSPGTKPIDSVNGIRIYRFFSVLVPMTGRQIFLALPSVGKVKKILVREGIDILHVMVPAAAGVISMIAARQLGIKIVAHSHTQPENIFMHWSKRMGNRAMNGMFYRYLVWVYRKADIVVCPSRFSEKLLRRYWPKMKAVVISNGVDLSKFKRAETAAFMKKHKLNPKEKHLLFVGRLHRDKSIDTLIKAMPFILREFRNVHLSIVGIGDMHDELKRLANKLGLGGKISFYGKLSDADLVRAYNVCDVFVLPSLAELEGMVVLEAMACGKPILISNSRNSAATYFVDGNGVLFRLEDPKDLAAKALKMLKDDWLRESMALKSFQKSREYDIHKSVSMLEKVYSSIKPRG